MAAPKFLKIIAGVITEVVTIATSAGAGDADKIPATGAAGTLDGTLMPGGAPVNTSAGAGDAGKLPKLDAAGKLDSTMMPAGVGGDSQSVTASEALTAGPVNLWNDSGTLKMRKADATTAGKEANGFVTGSVSSGASGTCYFDGNITGLSGLTIGETYYLSTTAGALVTTPPSGSGNIVQKIGKALSASVLSFEPTAPVTLA